MDKEEIRRFYLDQLKNKFLPYWMGHVDNEYGGVYTNISNDGENLISKDKYIWSQGRWLYILSCLLRLKEKELYSLTPILEESADKTANFLLSHSFDSSYRCVFKTRENGEWLKDEDGDYYSSIYADCFVVLGLSEYAKVKEKREVGRVAERIMDSVLSRIKRGNYKTAPYEIEEGYSSHGIPMILHSTLFVLSQMLESFGESREKYREEEEREIEKIFSLFLDKVRFIIMEYVSSNTDSNRLLDRHINPGHTLEDAWFWLDHYKREGKLEEKLPLIKKIVLNTFTLSWDKEYGGLYRYVDKDGGEIKGKSHNTGYEKLVEETWSMKLWWPHSEMLYLFLYLYKETKDQEFLSLYSIVKDYVFSTFPSTINGEWVQIRSREGKVEDRVVALPVKDPFHIIRDFLKIIELMEEHDAD